MNQGRLMIIIKNKWNQQMFYYQKTLIVQCELHELLFFIFYAYIIDVEIKLNIVINHKRRSQSITNARKIKQFCTYSNFIPTLASIFATHGRKFVKGKISFIKIKNGMKDEENAKTTFCGFIESMVCQNYALV